MPTNEYGQPTDSKGNVLTQSQVIEAELEPILNKLVDNIHMANYARDSGKTPAYSTVEARAAVAALVLKHRHDVYFAAYRDGLQQGRKEAQAMLDSSEEE